MSTGFAPGWSGAGVMRAPSAGDGEVARPVARTESTRLRLVCFFALAAFCGVQYATLLLHPPLLRVLGVALAATAFGAALPFAARLSVPGPAGRLGPGLRAAAGVLFALVALALALLAIGVPASLLAPGRWHTLGSELDRGFDGLAGWLWPYRGESAWARITVLSLLAPVQVAAAALCFWPGARSDRGAATTRRGLAFGLLLALLVTGLANQAHPAWRVEGVALLALVAAWLWLPALGAAAAPRAARWLLAAGVVALVLAPVLDAARPLIDFRSWNPVQASASFQWDQLYGPIPWSRSDATMFEVDESRPALLRVTTLDRFDGLRFLRSASPPADPSADLPQLHSAAGGFVTATIAIAGLRSPLLISAGGEPLRVRWLARNQPALGPAGDGTTTLSPTPSSGARYEVVSYAPSPQVAALRAAPARYPTAYLPYARFELPAGGATNLRAPDLAAEAAAPQPAATLVGAPSPGRTPASDPAMARRIAASPYGPAFALARRLARGARTPYDVAERIQSYLLANYVYDEHPPAARYPLEAFLFTDRRGYCQQFSGAMTLLLRMDGIPARVAAGFRPSSFEAGTGRATVTALDAHSWVEVFFSGIGWMPFDPTPPRPSGPAAPAVLAAPARPAPAGRGAAASSPAVHRANPLAAHVAARHSGAGVAAWVLALAAALAAVALLVAGWWLAGAARLRRALAGEGDGAIAELDAALALLGSGAAPATQLPAPLRPAGEAPAREPRQEEVAPTLAALEQRLAGRRGGRASAYLRALRQLRYGAPACAAPGSASGPRPSARGRAELRRALAEGGGPRARLRALLALPPACARRRAHRASA